MLPHSDDEKYLSDLCANMRSLYEKLKEFGLPFKYLSMGMRLDFEEAILEGANIVRIGTALFEGYETK